MNPEPSLRHCWFTRDIRNHHGFSSVSFLQKLRCPECASDSPDRRAPRRPCSSSTKIQIHAAASWGSSWATAGTRTASQTCRRTDGWWCRWWMGAAEVCSFAEPGASTHASIRYVPRVFPSLINAATDCSGTQALWFKSFKGAQTFSIPQKLPELTHVTFPVPLGRSREQSFWTEVF